MRGDITGSRDTVAMLFGTHVWPRLVEHRFWHRTRRPDKLQLRLYRRYLEAMGYLRGKAR